LTAITDIHDPRLVKALAHPLRVQILGMLQDRTASPSDLAQELDAPLGNVSYHVRILAQLGLLKLVKKRPRRGAIEHYYQARGRVRISDRAWGQVPTIVKEARFVQQAAESDGFERPEAHLIRQPMRLDAKGFKELSAAVAKLLDQANKIEAESAGRLAKSDHKGELDAGLVMLLFETDLVGTAPVQAEQLERADRRRTAPESRAR
jgi:DNA-binding transcriptional ArsR family regulator